MCGNRREGDRRDVDWIEWVQMGLALVLFAMIAALVRCATAARTRADDGQDPHSRQDQATQDSTKKG